MGPQARLHQVNRQYRIYVRKFIDESISDRTALYYTGDPVFSLEEARKLKAKWMQIYVEVHIMHQGNIVE